MSERSTDNQSSGAVTQTLSFLFSDIEGSARRWELHRRAMEEALRLHDGLIRIAVDECAGRIFKAVGDAFCAVFFTAESALHAALAAQRAIVREDWSALGGLHVRMAIHTGDAQQRDGDYFGPALNRVARLVEVARGGQVLISAASAELLRGQLPSGTSLRDLGSHALRDLPEPQRIFQLEADDLALDFPPLRTAEVANGNLPVRLTSFIGRQTEVAEIVALMDEARLVTVVGAGGVGKTRTAIQVALERAALYGDGTWFVDLAPITQRDLVASALASVLDVRDSVGSRPLADEVVISLRDRTALLILDNCEQVVAAAADLSARIVLACPKVHILATSREPLAVDGEEVFRMPSLSVPPASEDISAEEALRYEAVALFAARATSAQKSFELTDSNARFVAEIVRRLDGIALAIELAAPRVRAFGVRELATHLDQRFQLLASGSRTAIPRHQTLHALIEWSYELLADREQQLFRRLSIFHGSCSLDAVQSACCDEGGDRDEVLKLVSALVEKSLVAPDSREDEQRYRMQEATREFAFDLLAKSPEFHDIARRHCRYYASAAERASSETYELPSDRWIARHKVDLENYRAAIDWGLSHGNDVAAGAAIVADLRRFWIESFPNEGRTLLASAIAAVDAKENPELHASLVVSVAYAGYGSDTVETEVAELTQAVGVFAGAGDRVRQIDALTTLAFSLGWSDRIPDALKRLDQALALARRLSNASLIAATLHAMSGWLLMLGNHDRAKSVLGEAMAIYRRGGDRPGIARALLYMGEVRFADGDVAGALENAREAISIGRDLDDERALVVVLHNAAAYLLAAGDLDEGSKCARECLTIAVQRKSSLFEVVAIEDLAQINARCGELERAALLTGYADMKYARRAAPRGFTERFGYDRTMSLLKAGLPEARLSSLLSEGAELDEIAALAEAMETPQPQKAASQSA